MPYYIKMYTLYNLKAMVSLASSCHSCGSEDITLFNYYARGFRMK
jgi:hypothetical protein